jgi:ABC-type uncharacterized transport system substrate-binding protein
MPSAKSLAHRALCAFTSIPMVLAVASNAWAHPHTFIDLKSTIVLTGDGQIGAIRAQWTFDEYYTSDLMRQVGGVQAFADTALVNLAPYGYFTELREGTNKAKFDRPKDIAARLESKRLVLEFTLPLAKAAGQSTTLSVYDPTYYIEMLHGSASSVVFQGPGSDRCRANIIEAKPDEKTRQRAMGMDRQATADHSLGEKFAERVDITCS